MRTCRIPEKPLSRRGRGVRADRPALAGLSGRAAYAAGFALRQIQISPLTSTELPYWVAGIADRDGRPFARRLGYAPRQHPDLSGGGPPAAGHLAPRVCALAWHKLRPDVPTLTQSTRALARVFTEHGLQDKRRRVTRGCRAVDFAAPAFAASELAGIRWRSSEAFRRGSSQAPTGSIRLCDRLDFCRQGR